MYHGSVLWSPGVSFSHPLVIWTNVMALTTTYLLVISSWVPPWPLDFYTDFPMSLLSTSLGLSSATPASYTQSDLLTLSMFFPKSFPFQWQHLTSTCLVWKPWYNPHILLNPWEVPLLLELLTSSSEVKCIKRSAIAAHWAESLINSPCLSPTTSSGHVMPSFFLIKEISKLDV